ncbi:MAG: acyl carrier protein [Acidobacteriota bacterium]|jgi:acyl carrier protein
MSDPMEKMPGPDGGPEPAGSPGTAGRSVEEIQDWLVAYVANLLGVPEGEIDPETSFDDHGLDSIAAVAVAAELGGWLGKEIDLAEATEEVTIASVARLAAGN